MSISFNKLFDLLQNRGHSSTYWLRQNGFHSATVTKLRKNQTVTTETISSLCALLNVQPSDIMEYVPDDQK